MVLTVTLAIMTTERKIDISNRISYFWILILINVAFFIFWIAFYVKILIISIIEIKFFKDLISSKAKGNRLSKFIQAISRIVSEKSQKQYSQHLALKNQPKIGLRFNHPIDKINI